MDYFPRIFLTSTTSDEWRYLAAYGETFCEIIRGNYKELSPIIKKNQNLKTKKKFIKMAEKSR